MNFQNNSVNYDIDDESYTTTLDKTGKTSLIQAYSAWQFRANDKLTINAGLHTLLLTLNQKGSIEPRAGLRWNFMSNQTLSAGFGIHSRMEDLAVYTTQRKTASGELEFLNHNLGLSKAAHYVLGYDAMLSSMWHLKAEAYYQQLFNVPVNAEAKDAVSLINSSDGLNTTKLSNTGRGRNHGLELTLEKYFGNSWYLMNTLSLYQSTYSGSDNIWRNTQFNGNYAGSFLAGKEFKIKEKNLLSLNIRALYAGGRRYTAVLLDESNEAGYAVYDTKNAFEARGQAYWRIDLGVSYTINRKNTASVWKIDIQNVTNRLNEFGRFYNFDSRQLEVSTQTGIIPTLSYRFEF